MSPRQQLTGQLRAANFSGQQAASAMGGAPAEELTWENLLPQTAGASTPLSARRQAGAAEHRNHFFEEQTFFGDAAYHGPHTQGAHKKETLASAWQGAQLAALSPPKPTTSPQRAQAPAEQRATASQISLAGVQPAQPAQPTQQLEAEPLTSSRKGALHSPARHVNLGGDSVRELLGH